MPEAVKLERSHWSSEKELARSKKFSESWFAKPLEERKQIMHKCHERSNTEEAILKANITRNKHQSHTKSKAEDNFYSKLLFQFKEEDIVRHYVDVIKYPFECDFYIKSKDLYIEYQGHQTHGDEPFDLTNLNHTQKLVEYEQKGVDMSTWTMRDPKKLKVATTSGIKLLLVYPKNNFYLLKEYKLEKLTDFNIININDID